jgi:hypothetical protein
MRIALAASLWMLLTAPLAATAQDAGPAHAPTQKRNAHLMAAERLYQKLDLDAALAELDRAEINASEADSVRILVYRGLVFADQGKTNEANDQFKRALAIDAWASLPQGTSPRIVTMFADARKSIWGSPTPPKRPEPEAEPAPAAEAAQAPAVEAAPAPATPAQETAAPAAQEPAAAAAHEPAAAAPAATEAVPAPDAGNAAPTAAASPATSPAEPPPATAAQPPAQGEPAAQTAAPASSPAPAAHPAVPATATQPAPDPQPAVAPAK